MLILCSNSGICMSTDRPASKRVVNVNCVAGLCGDGLLIVWAKYR